MKRIRGAWKGIFSLAFSLAVGAFPWVGSAPPISGKNADGPSRSVLEQALAGPLRNVEEIVFATRLPYRDPHWYASIGYFCDNEFEKARPGDDKPDIGRLCKLNIRTREIMVLLDAQGGSIRDPQVHYDGGKILFAYRKADSDYYNLYEINVDGSGLRQITSGEYDDYEPTYLPDGGIMFVSTRCKRWVNCWMTQVAILYRCDGDGSNIEQLSANIEHDNTPAVLPDGRILYTRWEYVDRSQVSFHHLWTMNPDGTGQMIYYGNMHQGILMIDARPIPGTNKVVAAFSPGHGRKEHYGTVTIVSDEKGPDDRSAARTLNKALVKDPYPLSEDVFLAAQNNRILLLDGRGRLEPLYASPDGVGVHEPRPIMARPREPVVPRRSDATKTTGRFIVTDVYNGRNMSGVRRGEIKKLLVLETLPKPVNFSGGPDLTSWLGTFTLERILGTVPVEEDGSAYLEAPANRSIFFVSLDEQDLSVKRMQSFAAVRPGEVLSCTGCHEERTRTPANKGLGTVQALRRPASRIEPFAGFPDVMDFKRDIQPVLDRHCVSCHNYGSRAGNTILTGDLGPHWSHSYFSLLANLQVADGRNGLGNQPPRTIGSSASALMQKIGGSHHGVRVSPGEWRTVWLWLESGAPYAGTYAALRNEAEQKAAGAAAGRVYWERKEVLQRRCGSCHLLGKPQSGAGLPLPFAPEAAGKDKRGLQRETSPHERIVLGNDPLARFSPNILLNFTRPELSPLLLGPLSKNAGGYGSCGDVFRDLRDPDYRLLLASLEAAKAQIDSRPRFSTPGFRPNRQYIREMMKFGILSKALDASGVEIDGFETDRRYWESLWH